MTNERPDDEEVEILSGMAVVYAAMLAATIAGQLLGIAIDALLGIGSLGVPLGTSVALEAFAGARLGAARSGGALTPRQAGRIAATYSAGLAAISMPLLVWIDAAHRSGGAPPSWTMGRILLGVLLFVVATFARWGLMIVIAGRRRR